MNEVLARFQDSPALIEINRSEWFKACTEKASETLAAIEKESRSTASNDGSFWYPKDDWRSQYQPYNIINGVLQIPVRGVLLNNMPWQLGDWATGYEYIHQAVKRGLEDGSVTGIALVIESGGGMVSGNWDLVEYIAESRDVKPIRAIASDYAYSAAYNIAAATSHITVARTGGVGSIGVIVTHFDYSKRMESLGISVTFIRSKNDKAEGNSYEPLSKGAKGRIKSDVDELHGQFVNMVATNRSMDEADVDGTDAHTFMGESAVEAGLADAVGNKHDALTAFEATFLTGDEPMADYTQAEYDAAVASAREEGHAAGVTEGRAAGVTEGAKSAADRINSILASDLGKERPKAALSAALKTSMSVEEALAFMGDIDPEPQGGVNTANGAGGSKKTFAQAMEAQGSNEVGVDGSEALSDEAKAEAADKAAADEAMSFVRGPKKAS